MSNSAPTPVQTSTPAAGLERRRNPALRELIDEMLASIRSATNNELWTTDERTQYERELGEIMARVRSETVRRPYLHRP
jgi:predicted RNA-binding Zn ribbon-like protein